MRRQIFIVLILVINSVVLYAQQYTPKDLIGRWRSARSKQFELVFFTDSTGAWLMSDGFLRDKMVYSAKADKDIIDLKWTSDATRKHPNYVRSHIKFLNDSTFLIRTGWDIPKGADTSNTKVGVFVKIKHELPGTEMKSHSYKDLLGQWGNTFKGKINDHKFIFVNENTVYYKDTAQLVKLRYTIDLTQQPIPIDLYNGAKLVNQLFLGFYDRDAIRIEVFNKMNRGDHFTMFGQNTTFVREKGKINIPDLR